MNVLLIPLILASMVNQIQLAPDNVITADIVRSPDGVYLTLPPDKFSVLKAIVESTDNRCSQAVVESIGLCNYQIEACHATCGSTSQQQRNLRQVLENDITVLKADINLLEKQNTFFKYAAIVAGSVALASGTYIILK
jgi:hypothetical protein